MVTGLKCRAQCCCQSANPRPRVHITRAPCRLSAPCHLTQTGQACNFLQITSPLPLLPLPAEVWLGHGRQDQVLIKIKIGPSLSKIRPDQQVDNPVIQHKHNYPCRVLLIPVTVSCCVHLSDSVISSIPGIPPSVATHHLRGK